MLFYDGKRDIWNIFSYVKQGETRRFCWIYWIANLLHHQPWYYEFERGDKFWLMDKTGRTTAKQSLATYWTGPSDPSNMGIVASNIRCTKKDLANRTLKRSCLLMSWLYSSPPLTYDAPVNRARVDIFQWLCASSWLFARDNVAYQA